MKRLVLIISVNFQEYIESEARFIYGSPHSIYKATGLNYSSFCRFSPESRLHTLMSTVRKIGLDDNIVAGLYQATYLLQL